MTVVDAMVLAAAELPDPGQPSFAMLCAGYGMFLAGVSAWVRRRPLAPRVSAGSVVGFGVGSACWLVAVAIDRL